MPEIDRIPDALLLAAVKRAQLHQDRKEGVAIWQIKAHLGLRHNGWTTRQVRPLLDALVAAGLLVHAWVRSRNLWAVTSAGRRQASAFSELPESPQHRHWREARILADQEIERLRLKLREATEQATNLLDEPSAPSIAWLALGKRLERACYRMASVTYCLLEWQEPDDRRADIASTGGHAMELVRCKKMPAMRVK